jgi:hypothetical protein
MEALRGVSVWLGAAVLGSASCTLVWNLFGGSWSGVGLRHVVGIAAATLMFTVPGSALLSLAFAWSGRRGLPLTLRRALLVLLGALAGAGMMLPLGGLQSVTLGGVYGAATAAAWVGLHMVLYGREPTTVAR